MTRALFVAAAVTALLVLAAPAQARHPAHAHRLVMPQSARMLRSHPALEPHRQLHLAKHTLAIGQHALGFLARNKAAGTVHSRAVLRRGATWLQHLGERKKAVALERLAAIEERRLASADWQHVAVPYADRIWPGTGSWLLACSSTGSEGGWGRWVPNTGGSGAGGWMQFMSGTFYSYAPRAFAEAQARGVTIPRSLLSWYSTVGQAVTAAYMRSHGLDSGQWSGYRC